VSERSARTIASANRQVRFRLRKNSTGANGRCSIASAHPLHRGRHPPGVISLVAARVLSVPEHVTLSSDVFPCRPPRPTDSFRLGEREGPLYLSWTISRAARDDAWPRHLRRLYDAGVTPAV